MPRVSSVQKRRTLLTTSVAAPPNGNRETAASPTWYGACAEGLNHNAGLGLSPSSHPRWVCCDERPSPRQPAPGLLPRHPRSFAAGGGSGFLAGSLPAVSLGVARPARVA